MCLAESTTIKEYMLLLYWYDKSRLAPHFNSCRMPYATTLYLKQTQQQWMHYLQRELFSSALFSCVRFCSRAIVASLGCKGVNIMFYPKIYFS